MQKAPVLKGSGLAPIDDEPVHVFGRNLEARVVESREDDDKKEEDEVKHEDDDVETIKKRKFDSITGEENEETVFQGEFKLFVWDVGSSNWIEKGRGQLKLNDDLNEHRSRLIMRISGTFRIILNVAIRHSLFKVISSTKTSIRFSDSQNVWAASGSNAKQLGDLLNDRIATAAQRAQKSGDTTTKESKEKDNEVTTTEAKNDEKEDERHDAEENEDEADNHSNRDDETAAVEADGIKDRKKQSEEEGGVEEGESNDGDEKGEEDSADDEPEESHTSQDRSNDHKPRKEVDVDLQTSEEEDDDTHHRGRDETKKLKLG